MKLIIFTTHYPFSGEEFVDAELKILSNYFDKIVIITNEKNTTNCRSVTPHNVEVVIVNRKYDFIICLMLGCLRMFSISSIRELFYATYVLDKKMNINIFKTLLIYNTVSERNIRWIRKNIDKDETDVLLYSYWLSSSAYALSRLKKLGYKCKSIARAHGGDAFIDREYQSYRNIIYRYLDEIHFVSDAGREQFYDKVQMPADSFRAKLFTSRLGTEKPNKIMNKCNKDLDACFHIVTCSSIIPLKRLDLLVDALWLIEGFKIKWTHFGEGYLKDCILHDIEEKIDKKNIQIDFLGQVSNDKIHRFYSDICVNLFINMSDYEGIPVSIMEAISYGIPVMARNIGGNSEIVYNGTNGVLLPSDINPKELAEAIKTFINLSNEEIVELRRGAYQIWEEQYNARENYHCFATHIKNIA